MIVFLEQFEGFGANNAAIPDGADDRAEWNGFF